MIESRGRPSGHGSAPALLSAVVLLLAGAVASHPARAQEPGPGDDLGRGELYRRTPLVGGDPFAGLLVDRPSATLSARAAGGNSALALDELGAILLLAERDSLRPGDALDALGLAPQGRALAGYGDGGAGLRAGLPLGRRLTVGVSLQGRGYGSFRVDEDAVALLRDGNASRSEFMVGESRGDGLAAAEVGAHAVLRPAGIRGPGGARVAIGAGVRLVRPLYYARFLSLLEDRSRVLVSADSVRARVSVASDRTPSVGGRGAGALADLMARFEWPNRGVAVEASVRDLGGVNVDGLVRRREDVDISTTRLDTVVDVVESLSFPVTDTVSASVSPPAMVAVTTSVWSGLPVQLDGRILLPVGGDFERPPPVGEVAATWRHGSLPVRTGVRVGGLSGFGMRLGSGWESDAFFVRASAITSGGIGGAARGVAANLEAGVWF